MKADGVLVQAAFALGKSRVPGDTTEIFNKQYEGLIAYNAAKAHTIAKGVVAGVALSKRVVEDVGSLIAGKPVRLGRPEEQGTQSTQKTTPQQPEIKKKRRKIEPDTTKRRKIKVDPQVDEQFFDQAARQAEVEEVSGILEEDLSDFTEGSAEIGSVGTGAGGYGLSGGGPPYRVQNSPFKDVEEQPVKSKTRNIQTQTTNVKPDESSSVAETKEEQLTVNDIDNAIDKMVTDLTVSSLTESADHYNSNGPMNEAHFEAAELAFRNIKNELYNISNKKNPTLEDKKRQNQLNRKTNLLKNNVVNYKALVKQISQAYSEGLTNDELSLKGMPNEQILLKQVTDPKADLKKYGIYPFWKDEELYYEYGPSQIFMEYANNKNIQVDPEIMMQQGRNIISGNDLLKMVVLKDTKSENDINSVIRRAGDEALATIGNTQNLLHRDFSRIEADIETDLRSIFENSKANLQDLFTRDLSIGGLKRNYKKDLEAHPAINSLTYANLGLTGSADKNMDGIISGDELSPEDKAIIIETLTNPRTAEQKKAAIDTRVDYDKKNAMAYFNYMREQSGLANDDYTVSKMTPQEIIKKFTQRS